MRLALVPALQGHRDDRALQETVPEAKPQHYSKPTTHEEGTSPALTTDRRLVGWSAVKGLKESLALKGRVALASVWASLLPPLFASHPPCEALAGSAPGHPVAIPGTPASVGTVSPIFSR